MGVEIERKFLVIDDGWRSEVDSSHQIHQGYFDTNGSTVRVRRIDDRARLTIKGATRGIVRSEWEYEIPPEDADELIRTFCETRVLRKTRHVVSKGNHVWEIDVFEGAFEGLIVAEIELESETTPFNVPSWLGVEVSHDPRYFNQALVTAGKVPT